MGSTDPESHKLQGNKLFKAKQYLKAAGEYSKAMKLDKTSHVYPSNLAAALLAINKYKQALGASETAISLKPEFEKGHFRRGQALEGLERYEEAAEAYMEAARLNPSNQEAMKKVQGVAAKMSEPPESVREAVHIAGQMEASLKEREEEEAEKKRRLKEETQAKAEAALEAEKQRIAESSMNTAKQLHQSASRMRSGGSATEYDSQRILRFAQVELEGLRDPENAEQYASPLAIILPGAVNTEWGDEGCGVAMNAAFESPDNHSEAQAFLRQHAASCRAHAVLMIVPKDKIAFPRVWTKGGKTEPEGTGGFFVQLQTLEAADRCMWWMAKNESGSWVQEVLDYEEWQIMGTLLRKED
eukprot:TRINITY_DN3267_c0_g1_i1.p1 TRINITY_DN3267_c0_g1~~TRINITY_DN3267_c0_g1_i1.p1  ORF type:complete len:357 (+),score=109.12 TRINITY_DN3267_c0_g1_i1:76-1146(+)